MTIDLRPLRNSLGNDMVSVRAVIDAVVSESPRLASHLSQAVADRRIKEASRSAHSLKSTVGHVGDHELADLCAEFEEAARDEVCDLEALAIQIVEAVEMMMQELSVWRDGQSA